MHSRGTMHAATTTLDDTRASKEQTTPAASARAGGSDAADKTHEFRALLATVARLFDACCDGHKLVAERLVCEAGVARLGAKRVPDLLQRTKLELAAVRLVEDQLRHALGVLALELRALGQELVELGREVRADFVLLRNRSKRVLLHTTATKHSDEIGATRDAFKQRFSGAGKTNSTATNESKTQKRLPRALLRKTSSRAKKKLHSNNCNKTTEQNEEKKTTFVFV